MEKLDPIPLCKQSNKEKINEQTKFSSESLRKLSPPEVTRS
jgi:hypothetical protein